MVWRSMLHRAVWRGAFCRNSRRAARPEVSEAAEYECHPSDPAQGANTVSLSLQAGSMTLGPLCRFNVWLRRVGRLYQEDVWKVDTWKPCQSPCPVFESLPILTGGVAARLRHYRKAPSRAGGGSASCSGPVDHAVSSKSGSVKRGYHRDGRHPVQASRRRVLFGCREATASEWVP